MSRSEADIAERIEEALARAVIYRVVSIAFQAPTTERLRQIGTSGHFRTVADALAVVRRSTPGAPVTSELSARLTAFEPPAVEELRATFVKLFGHTTRGPVCACETEYGADNTYHQPQQLADICGYYMAFGLDLAPAGDLRADHVTCECEFMDFVNRKEALFLGTRADDGETLEVTRQAGRTFLRDHLGRFGRAFATRVSVEDPEGFYGMLGAILFDLLDRECLRLGIVSGPIDLAVRPDLEDDAPMACGVERPQELIQIQRRP